MTAGGGWREIWNRPSRVVTASPSLADLIEADGWNTFGRITDAAFVDHQQTLGRKLGIAPGDTIFEVGCGAGASLFPWYDQGHLVAGIDYAEPLVTLARAAMPRGTFLVGDASELPSDQRFDIVLATGVFFYFQDLAYAAQVLRRMFTAARKAVGVFDVADAERRTHALERRRKALGPDEYDRRYAGLDHLYFPRRWFASVLNDDDVAIEIEDQALPGYFQNEDRFNVLIRRRGVTPPLLHAPDAAHRAPGA